MVGLIRSLAERLGAEVDNPYWEGEHQEYLAGEAWLVAALKEAELSFRKNAEAFKLTKGPRAGIEQAILFGGIGEPSKPKKGLISRIPCKGLRSVCTFIRG